jgi:hypothetical protein
MSVVVRVIVRMCVHESIVVKNVCVCVTGASVLFLNLTSLLFDRVWFYCKFNGDTLVGCLV